MAEIMRIEDIAQHVGQHVSVQGWLQLKTDKGKLQFLRVRDGTGVAQAVVFHKNVSPETLADAKRLPLESSLANALDPARFAMRAARRRAAEVASPQRPDGAPAAPPSAALSAAAPSS